MTTTTNIAVDNGSVNVELLTAGEGQPILYLHGVLHIQDDPLLVSLSKTNRLVAPMLPGYGNSTGGGQVTDIHDLALYYAQLVAELELDRFVLVGHSLGGMFAAELAAVIPERVSHLVLMAPFGLWDDAYPTLAFFAALPGDMAAAFYFDQMVSGAKAIAAAPQEIAMEVDPDTPAGQTVIDILVEQAKTMSSAVRYLWPIPDRGLRKRLYRLTMPTLLLWGEDDGVVDPQYAELFANSIATAETGLIPKAGHMLNDEKPKEVADQIETFISS